jgi:hypothetical protein
LSLSVCSLPEKYNEILNARLAAAETSTDAWRITFGFIGKPYSTQLKKAGMNPKVHARLFNMN